MFKLHDSASQRFSKFGAIKAPNPEGFFDDILIEMKSSGKTVKLRDNKGTNHISAMVSLNPPQENLDAPTTELLGLLYANMATFSNDLRTFSDHMNVTASEEMDEVYEAISLLSVFIKVRLALIWLVFGY